jgi:energy-converting hydrogenase Eha subunit E
MAKNPSNYNSQTRSRLVIWFVVLLFTLGLGLIWLVYGKSAALIGFFCLLGMVIPVGLVALVMFGLNKVNKKINK